MLHRTDITYTHFTTSQHFNGLHSCGLRLLQL